MASSSSHSFDARPRMTPGGPACPKMSVNLKSAKTNPPQRVRVLSPQLRAAARAMVVGKTVGQTVREVRVARRTLFRWRRLPAFVAKMRRLHEHLAMASAAVGG